MSNSFLHFLAESLNEKQKSVVEPKNDILAVCAGAGSGKTRIITARIANLIINHNVLPENILALTFTNKAAKEMKERVAKFLPNQVKLPFVGTFHSYCLKTLKSNPNLIKFPQFSLLDESDKDKLIKAIIKKLNLSKNFSSKSISAAISRAKNESTSFKQLQLICQEDPILSNFINSYESEKAKSFCLDFDDLLLHTIELFNNPEFQEKFQNNIKHVLVDEYQDTNIIQHELLKKMCLQNKKFALDSLCVVGDEDQSIYSWRGANVDNIINFSKDFLDCKSITVEQNYRSVKPILDAANSVIKYNNYRNAKKLWSDKEAKDRIRILGCSSPNQEGRAISYFLKELQNKENLNSCAILYRSHYQSRLLEEALIKESIPYKIVGGIQFYERQEIKDLLAYLKLIINPQDRVAFSRVINIPQRGLGDKFEELFYEHWDSEPFFNFKEVCIKLIYNKLINLNKSLKLKEFLEAFDNFSAQDKTSTILKSILEKTKYKEFLDNKFEKDEAKAKRENVKEFIDSICYFESQENKNLEEFLEEVALLQELQQNKSSNSNLVSLMTFHAAKGLEFDNIIIAGLEEGVLPSSRSMFESDNVEEERRLFYVGITRARERVLLTHSSYRFTYGQMMDQRPSRFIDELDANFIQQDKSNYWDIEQTQEYFNNWLEGKNSKITFDISDLPKPSYLKENKKTIKQKSNSSNWRQYQTVKHSKFGVGVIQQIEEKSDKIFLTIRFSSGIKKLDSSFIS